MIKNIILGTSIFFLAATMTPGFAKVESQDTAKTITSLKQKLKTRFRTEPSSIKESKLPNVYEVMYGTEVIYVSNDGKYFLAGDMINLDTRENVSEIAKRSVRREIIDKQDNKPVIFKAKDEKHVVKVFTDIDCAYCAKLHREMPAINAKGITIEYLMFPRAGIGSGSYKKAVSMWCAEDQLQAMTDAKARKPIADKSCENPVEAQYNLGQEVGVTGTPALVTESGRLIPGYMPADKLAAALEADKK